MNNEKLFEEVLEESQRYTPGQPINTAEECERALLYIESQLYEMSSLITDAIDNEITINFAITNRLTESDISNGLDLYSNIADQIRKRKSNVDLTIIRIQEFLQHDRLSPKSPIFKNIERWIRRVEEDLKEYNEAFIKSKRLLPDISELCQGYLDSIVKLNVALASTNIKVREPEFQ